MAKKPCGRNHSGLCGTQFHSGKGHGTCGYCEKCKSCFITTATLQSIGKTDDCEELNKFRQFRDNWLSKQDDGAKLINDYYLEAPEIVKAIDRLANHQIIYSNLWTKSIEPCLRLIENGQYEAAKSVYCAVVLDLKHRYLSK